MNERVKAPCNECPWKKSSPPGYLGGNSVGMYSEPTRRGTPLPCHKTMEGDSSGWKACYGQLTTMRNSCILPVDENDKALRHSVPTDRENYFNHIHEFESHHEGVS